MVGLNAVSFVNYHNVVYFGVFVITAQTNDACFGSCGVFLFNKHME